MNSRYEAAGQALASWFQKNGRDLPWRHTRDPYRIWLSEVMLQQTRVETVLGYYHRFLEKYPDVLSLAAAERDDVFKLWEGLGYYRRAEYLMKAAVYIRDCCGGVFPDTAEALRKVPGIGPYTAGAIAATAFGERAAAVDGNVLRVVSRLDGLHDPVGSTALTEASARAALAMMPPDGAWSHTQAMMDLGATVCLPKAPHCGLCPLRDLCLAFDRGEERELPLRPEKKAKKVISRQVYLLCCDGRVLLRRRPETGLLRGMWEFPADEEGENFLAPFAVTARSASVDKVHVFTHRIWEMHSEIVQVKEPATPERCRWMTPAELEAAALPSAMAEFRKAVLAFLEAES